MLVVAAPSHQVNTDDCDEDAAVQQVVANVLCAALRLPLLWDLWDHAGTGASDEPTTTRRPPRQRLQRC